MMSLQPGDLDLYFRYATQVDTRLQGLSPKQDDQGSDYKIVHQQIQDILGRQKDGLSRVLVASLSHPIEVAVRLDYQPADAFKTFRTIVEAIRPLETVAPLDDEKSWVDAIEIAKCHRMKSGVDLWVNMTASRGFVVAQSLRRLRERGYSYEINAFGVGLEAKSFEKACLEIGRKIQRLGGFMFSSNILSSVKNKTFEGLFLSGRTTSQTGRETRSPNVPWHFLYNLALKYLALPCTTRKPQEEWMDVIELARDVGASLDVEEYSAYATMSLSPYLINREVLDNTFYDELFGFQQWRPADGANLFSLWVDALAKAKCPEPLISWAKWRKFGQSFISKAEPFGLIVTTSIDHISPEILKKEAASILRALAVPISELNKDYITPVQTEHRNAPFYPAIAISGGRYVLPPQGLAARGLYEGVCTLMRAECDKDLEKKLGDAFEFLTDKVLRDAGHVPSISSAKYDHPTLGREFEMDFAYESDSHITLIECKMKALRRSSRGPSTIDALVDLTKSFLATQIQMARHEIALKTLPILQLKDGKSLALNGRQVERISLTMLDHGSLQDRNFTRNIIACFFGMQLNSGMPELAAALKQFNDAHQELQGYLSKLAEIEGVELGKFLHQRSFNTWWFSIDQLALIAKAAPSLPEALKPIRSITFQTGDIMNELANMRRIQQSAAES